MDRHGTFERTWDIQTDIFGQRDIFSYKYFGSLQPNGAITRHATYFKTFLGTSLSYMQSFVKIGGTVLEKFCHRIQRDIHLLSARGSPGRF